MGGWQYRVKLQEHAPWRYRMAETEVHTTGIPQVLTRPDDREVFEQFERLLHRTVDRGIVDQNDLQIDHHPAESMESCKEGTRTLQVRDHDADTGCS